MRTAKISVPAVSANLGPGMQSVGLALALHVSVTLSERRDTRLLVDMRGEGSTQLPPDVNNPVIYAAVRVFQRMEDAPLGLHADIRNQIPLGVGLGSQHALTVAGLVGANVLMESPLSRDELITIGAELTGRPDSIVAAMLGGLTVTSRDEGRILARRMEVVPLKLIVVAPRILDYDPALQDVPVPSIPAAVHNLGRVALLVDALRRGDFDLLAQTLDDQLLEPHLAGRIPGFNAAVQAAKAAGAVGVSISGDGPALLIFALYNHRVITSRVEAAFNEAGFDARSWVLAADTQGVVISAAESVS